MDDRKRRLSGEDGPLTKKHILSKDVNGIPTDFVVPPLPNGMGDQDDLSQFQKEAIWRQMQEYRRQCERAQSRIEFLESAESTLAQRTAAADSAWSTLIHDLHLIAQNVDQRQPPTSESKLLTALLSDLHKDANLSEIQSLLDSYSSLAKGVVTQIYTRVDFWLKERQTLAGNLSGDAAIEGLKKENLSLASVNKQQLVNLDDLQARCQTLAKEAQLFKNELALSKKRLNETVDRSQQISNDLGRAEKHLDRLRSGTVQSVEGIKAKQPGTPAVETPGKDVDMKDATPTPAPDAVNTELMNSQLEEAKKTCDDRLREIEGLRNEQIRIQQQADQLQLQLSTIPDAKAIDTNAYRQLYASYSAVKTELDNLRPQHDALLAEIEQLKANQKEFVDQVQTEAGINVAELKAQMTRLDADVGRLRSQREDLLADVAVRTQQERVRMDQVREIKTLAESRSERIKSLLSENSRLHMKLSGSLQDATVLADIDSDLTQIAHLQKQLAEAQAAIITLQAQLTAVTSASEVAAQQADLASRVAELTRQLAVSEKNVKGLQSRPGAKEDQDKVIASLQAQVQIQEQSSKQLMMEIESLGKAWAGLEEQNKNKVLDLVAKEEQLQRLSAEKAKADQKYFAVMKAKDAALADTQALRRSSKKQTEVIERLSEVERSVTQQLSLQEKELSATRQAVELGGNKYNMLVQQHNETLNQLETSKRERNATAALLQARSEKAAREEAVRVRAEEQIAQLEKQISKHKKAEATAAPELVEELEQVKKTLRCSACNLRFFSHCITRCMHLCCKPCIDKRIETRQRKCPICAEPFGGGDVRQVYF